MRGLIALLLVTALGWSGSGVAAAAAAAAAAPDAAVVARIERHVADGIEANGVPGAALAVVLPDGSVHARGFGTKGRGGEPVTDRTPFLIGSASKSFTALAVLQLVEQGLVALDDPVDTHLPWFHVTPVQHTPLVTVRDAAACAVPSVSR